METAKSGDSSKPQVGGASNGSGDTLETGDKCCCEMLQFQFLKSALTVNPCMVRGQNGMMGNLGDLFQVSGFISSSYLF